MPTSAQWEVTNSPRIFVKRYILWADRVVRPLGSYEFAADSRKIGVCRRVGVGIDPYKTLHGQRLNVQTASDFAEIL